MTTTTKERRTEHGKCRCGGNQELDQDDFGVWLIICDKCKKKLRYRRGSDWKLPIRKLMAYCSQCKKETLHKDILVHDKTYLRCVECGVCPTT